MTSPALSIAPVALDDVINIADKAAGVEIAGTVTAGTSSVIVTVAGVQRQAQVIGTNWAYTLTGADYANLGQGARTVDVTASDSAGNGTTVTSAPFTIDTIAPNAPAVASVTDDVGTTETIADGGASNDTTPTIRVSLAGTNAIAGDTVQLYANGTALGNAVTLVADDITASHVDITPAALGESVHAFTARVTDASGNEGSVSASHSVTIDTTAQSAPAIASVTDDTGSIAGAVANGGVTDDTELVVRVSLAGTNALAGDMAAPTSVRRTTMRAPHRSPTLLSMR